MKIVPFAPMLVLPLLLANAHAQESGTSSIKVSGFGTGALTWTDTNDAQFVRPFQASGARKKPRTGVDSNVGLQVDATINEWLSLTGQGLARKDGEDDFGADATLAFAKFKLSDTLSVRVGRVPLGVFMVSDYRHVGYANTMVRQSQEVYSQIPMTSQDGGDVTWQRNVGDTVLTAQLAGGRATNALPGGARATVTGSTVVSFGIEHGPFTGRLSRNNADLVVEGPSFKSPKTKVSFTGAGFGLDWNNILVQSEYTKARGFGNSNAWYAMGGYRFGKVLPFYQHGKLTGKDAQSTDSVGVRWDAFRSADIKFQVDRIKPEGVGLFAQPKPGFRGPVTVGAVTVDFVF